MELFLGDKPLKVPAPHVPAKLSDGSDSDQETVNDALFQSIVELHERLDNIEAETGIVHWPLVGDDGETYVLADCHKFISYGTSGLVDLPTKVKPVLLLVNGRRQEITRSTRAVTDPEIIARNGARSGDLVDVFNVSSLNEDDVVLAVFDYDNGWGNDLSWVKKIDQIGLNRQTGERNQVASVYGMMKYMPDNQPVVAGMDVSHLTDWGGFSVDSVFNSPINHWDARDVTDMSYMFCRNPAFNEPLSNWEVSQVQWFDAMFQNATAFNQSLTPWCSVSHRSSISFDDGATSWSPGNKHVPGTCPVPPEDMYHIFWSRGAETWATMPTNDLETDPFRTLISTGESFVGDDGYTYNRYKAIFSWDNGVKNRSLSNYGRIEQIGREWSLGKRNTVTNGVQAFRVFRADKTEPLNAEFVGLLEKMDTSHFDSMHRMFDSSNYLGPMDLTGWDVSNVTTTYRMFYNAGNAQPNMRGWDVSKIENMADTFYGCKGVDSPGLDTWNPTSLTNISRMFYNANNFRDDISDWDVSKCSSFSRIFYFVTKVNGDYGKWDVTNGESFEFLFANVDEFLTPINLAPWRDKFTNPNTTLWGVFQNTYDGLGGHVPQGMQEWDTSNVVSTRSTFWNCLFVPDVRSWDLSNSTNMESLFQGTNFDYDISHWNTSKCTTMRQMFKDDKYFNADLSGWCVSLISSGSPEVLDFDTGCDAWVLPRPVWGTCP